MTKDIEVIDAEALRTRYLEERDKRLNAAAGRTFTRLEKPGQSIDPHTPITPRDPVHDDVTFTFVGAGFSGLITAARVKEANPNATIRILDQAGDFGGVWYWNRYPGAMCDTASMIYLPLLEETNYMPTKKYAYGPEIHEHCQRIAKHYNLYDNALFHTAVTGAAWNEEKKRWTIKTSRGDEFTTKYLAVGPGPLSVAQLPGIPGIDSFKGKSFHTARWDYEFTGGDRNGGEMTNLKDKRVAIIGTGATSVQIVPQLARDSKELYVFQRTPSHVDVRNNHDIDPEWFKSITQVPGWGQRWLDNFTDIWGLMAGRPEDFDKEYEDLIQDGWSQLALATREIYKSVPKDQFNVETIMKAMETADNKLTTRIRARVDELVTEDPVAAKGLKAWYRRMCKRPCFHDEYLQAFNRPNVHLVDTEGEGVDSITEKGVHALGKDYEVDVIIYASGFEYINTSYCERLGFEIEGAKEDLTTAWTGGMRTLHGLYSVGFPNLFHVQLPQAALLASNVPSNFIDSARVISGLVKYMEEHGKETVEPEQAAQDAWVKDIVEQARPRASAECTPGYYNNEGNIRKEFIYNSGYPGGATAYFKLMRAWTDKGLATGEFEGVTFA